MTVLKGHTKIVSTTRTLEKFTEKHAKQQVNQQTIFIQQNHKLHI
jgi:hypothetical protein